MRRLLLIAALCFLAVATTGCKKAQLRRQLKELMGSTIVLPENITCVNNGEIYPMPDSLRGKAKLIIYIDSTECTTCRISQLRMYHQLQELADETGSFELILLLADTSFEKISLTQYLSDLELGIPVYVDADLVYREINPLIPVPSSFRAVLVDKTGKVIYAGDPVFSKHGFRYFKMVLGVTT